VAQDSRAAITSIHLFIRFMIMMSGMNVGRWRAKRKKCVAA
jgi:hypothetical protein